jgi:hypothetical protein
MMTGINHGEPRSIVGMHIHWSLAFWAIDVLIEKLACDRLWMHVEPLIGSSTTARNFGKDFTLKQNPATFRTEVRPLPIERGFDKFLLAPRTINAGWSIE